MATTQTTKSVLDNLLANYFVPTALATLYNETPLYELAQKDAQPKGQGDTTYWNAWVRLAGASSTLTEGGSNSLPALSSRRVSAQIDQYGRGFEITDVAQATAVLDPKSGGREVLMESAKETLEFVTQMGIYKSHISKNQVKTTNLSSYISSVASAFCAVTGTHNGDIQFQFPAVFGTSCSRLSAVSKTAPSASAQLSVAALRKVKVALDKQNAKPYADGYYIAYGSPGALATLRRDPTWTDWNKYMQTKTTMYKGEVGMVEGFRFIQSNLAFQYRVAAHSVNGVFCFGRGAYGVTSILGGLEMFYVTGPDSNNQFNTKSSITYKISAAAAALNPSAGRILWVHEKL